MVVILGASKETPQLLAARDLKDLVRIGGKFAVLGVEDGPRAFGWWHFMRPGSWTAPQGSQDPRDYHEGDNLAYGKALCGKTNVVTNGATSDFKPPKEKICPGCRELL